MNEVPDVICCFCGKELKYESSVLINFTLANSQEEYQNLFSHIDCFYQLLDIKIPRILGDL